MRLIKRRNRNVAELEGREAGRRLFILGNGPSILEENLALLSGEVVIGMNASTMLEEQYGFVSTYYVLSDTRFISHADKRQWCTSRLSPETIRVVRDDLCRYDDPGLPNRTYYIPAISRDGFSRDLKIGYFFGCTTTMLAVQLAYHLRATEVYLLGCDLRYPEDSPRFYAEDSPQIEDPFTSVQIFNLANAGQVFCLDGRGLYNCSERSFLRPYLKFRRYSDVVRAR